MLHQDVRTEFPIGNRRLLDDLEDLFEGPPDPGNDTAAPSGKGHGGKGRKEAGQLQGENYQTVDPVPSGSSVLDQPIHVTTFPTQAAQSKHERSLSLRELADEIEQASASEKARLPWFKLARFGDQRTEKNCLRNNANVLAVTGVEADYDAGAIGLDEAERRLRKAGVAGLIYSTPSHTAAAPRWRVFAPFSQEHGPQSREAFMARLNGVFDGTLDGASFTLSQSYYGGNVEGRPAIDPRLVDGRPIDHADALDATALPKGRKRRDESEDAAPDESGSGALFRLAARYRRLGRTRQDFTLAVWKDASASAHVRREEKVAPGRGERAIERAWARAPEPAEPEIDNLDEIAPLAPDPKRLRLAFLSPSECAGAPSRGYVIKNLIAPRDVACIFGQPGAGKSLIAPFLGYMVAKGDHAFGMRTKAGGVFYVAAEDAHGMRGRVTALRLTHGDAEGFTLVEGVSDLLRAESPDLGALRSAVAERKPSLIVIDTLAMAFPGLEENSAEAMGRVVAVARSLTKHGAAVVLVHHSTKDSNGTPRGHSLLNGALDVALELAPRDESGVIRGRLTKNRNGPCDLDLGFRIGVRSMGVDEDGDPVTAAHCAPMEASELPRREERLSASEKAALEILKNMGGQGGQDADEIPESAWREACVASRAVSATENEASRLRAVRRLITSLTQKRRVVFVGDFVRLPIVGSVIDDGDIDDLDAPEPPKADKNGQSAFVNDFHAVAQSGQERTISDKRVCPPPPGYLPHTAENRSGQGADKCGL